MASPNPTPPRAEVQPGIWLDARLGLFLEALGLLVVADLHWGYVESHRARGNLLPAWGDDEIERRLAGLLRDYGPREMLWLGDSLHAVSGRSRAEAFLRHCPVPTLVLEGNHDARWTAVQARTHERGRYRFHHGDRPLAAVGPELIEVVGHHHPAVHWSDGAGSRLRLPALVVNPRRFILPAFSPWSMGSHWTPTQPDETVWAIASRRIFAIKEEPRVR